MERNPSWLKKSAEESLNWIIRLMNPPEMSAKLINEDLVMVGFAQFNLIDARSMLEDLKKKKTSSSIPKSFNIRIRAMETGISLLEEA